jgi:glucose-1-phosphatase
MIRAITFDFGKVIGFFDHRLTSQRLAAHSTLPPDELHAQLYGGDLEEAYERGRLSTAEFLALARDRGRLTCDEDLLGTAWADIFWRNEDVIALLPHLKPHYRLLLGSNTNELHSRQFLRQFEDALSLFDHLVLSHQVRTRKPEPEFFRHCQRLAGCPPSACLFIDDLPENVAGARACGWHGVVYAGIEPLRRDLAGLGVRGAYNDPSP